MSRAPRAPSRQAGEAWARRARAKQCVVCGARGAHGHHIIKQQVLRQKAQTDGLDYERLRWDKRNMLPLCDRHHAGHHSKMHAISLSIVLYHQPKVVQFARELDLVWWLSREYPHHTTRRPR